MTKEKKQPENSETQALEMARQVLGRVKEMDLTAEQKEKVMTMIDQAQTEEKAGNKSKALNIFIKLKRFLESVLNNNSEFQEKSFNFLKKLLEKTTNKHTMDFIVSSLAGLDIKEAWKLRQDLLGKGVDPYYVSLSLGGLDSEEAWEMRQQIKDMGKDLITKGIDRGYDFPQFLAVSLAGLDSKQAWDERGKLFKKGEHLYAAVAEGLAGLDSEQAWQMRKEILGQIKEKGSVAVSLIGVDSEQAWQMREDMLAQGVPAGGILHSLAGLDSEKAWQMRQELLEQGDEDVKRKRHVVESLAGLDSEKAWQLRQELLDQGDEDDKESVAESLAGLDSEKAWQLRQELLDQGIGASSIAKGVYGDCLLAGAHKAKQDRKK